MAGDPKGFAALSDPSGGVCRNGAERPRLHQVQSNNSQRSRMRRSRAGSRRWRRTVGVRSKLANDASAMEELGNPCGVFAALGAKRAAQFAQLAADAASFANLQVAAGLMAKSRRGSPSSRQAAARFGRRAGGSSTRLEFESAGRFEQPAISAVGAQRKAAGKPVGEPRRRWPRWPATVGLLGVVEPSGGLCRDGAEWLLHSPSSEQFLGLQMDAANAGRRSGDGGAMRRRLPMLGEGREGDVERSAPIRARLLRTRAECAAPQGA